MAVGSAVGAVGNSVGSDQYGGAVRTTIGNEGRAVVGTGVVGVTTGVVPMTAEYALSLPPVFTLSAS